jgi:hypothetical protein
MAPRLITAALSLAGAAAFGLLFTAVSTDPTGVAAAAGRMGWAIPACLSLIALLVLTLALAFASPRPIVLAVALLGAVWLVGVPATGGWRSLAAPAGAWLLAVGELAYWSIEFEVAGANQRTMYVRRAATIAALTGSSAILAAVPQLDLSPIQAGGLELTVAGLLAAAALVSVAAALAWRLRQPADSSGPAAPASR